MQNAIQFITHKKNHRLIEIPEEFADQISGQFQVILILENSSEEKTARNRSFKAFQINTKDFTFNRDEIYEE